jgi:hypothetical protein
VHSVTAAAEARRVIVHALCMGHYYSETVEAFTAIARGTGGQCVPADSAVQVVEKMAGMLAADFADLPFDRQVLETFQRLEDPGVQAIAEALDCPRGRAAAALARLGRRGFLEPAPA